MHRGKATRGHRKKQPSANQRERKLTKKSNLSTTWSQTFGLNNWENKFLLFKASHLCYFVRVTLGDAYTRQLIAVCHCSETALIPAFVISICQVHRTHFAFHYTGSLGGICTADLSPWREFPKPVGIHSAESPPTCTTFLSLLLCLPFLLLSVTLNMFSLCILFSFYTLDQWSYTNQGFYCHLPNNESLHIFWGLTIITRPL